MSMSTMLPVPVDQDTTARHTTLPETSHATFAHGYYLGSVDAVERSNMYRPPSHQLFSGAPKFSFNITPSSFDLPLQRSDSIQSNISLGMSEDELGDGDGVQPWEFDEDGDGDFAFSSGLADACTYYMRGEDRPCDFSDFESDVDETLLAGLEAAHDDSEEELELDSDDEDASETETEVGGTDSDSDEPRDASPSISVAEDSDEWATTPRSATPPVAESEFLAASWLPHAWVPVAPIPLTASYPRRSSRVSRPSSSALLAKADSEALPVPRP
ncbi:hypothetical protein GGX14DRAFT_434019 [Mycena pura]|uniref:Uncharacterized protein n=1 Tax=Mycena pura TaxID=153505 RepID=A0AAD6VR14_9AGAR|nr:hypothetical protein GGX14DRAFT_434019 [Mycena pura]